MGVEKMVAAPRQGQARAVDTKGLLSTGLTILLWASAFAGIRAGLTSYSPASVALLRYLVASVVLAGYALLTRMPLPDRHDLPGTALAGFLGFTVYNLALSTGEVSTPAGVASFIIASAPIYIAILAAAFFGERLSPWGWLGIGLSFAGVAAISLTAGDGFRLNPRAWLVLLAAAVQAAYSVGQKPYLKRYGALRFVTYAIWAGTLFLLCFTPGLIREFQAASRGATLAVVYMGVFPGAIAYVNWSHVLSRIPASVAGSYLYLVPAFAALIAWAWLGEALTLAAMAGGLVILAGVVLVSTRGRAAPG